MSASESQKSQKTTIIKTLIHNLKTNSTEDFNQAAPLTSYQSPHAYHSKAPASRGHRKQPENTETYNSNYNRTGGKIPLGYARDVANIKKTTTDNAKESSLNYLPNHLSTDCKDNKSAFAQTFELTQ